MLRRNFLLLGLLPFYMYIRKSKAERFSMDVVRGQRKSQIMLDEDCLPKPTYNGMGFRGDSLFGIELTLDKPFSINTYINKGSV